MKKIIYILLFLISYTAYSQSLSLFNVDASNFPTIKASFFAFDAAGKQITNLSPTNFSLTENGIPRTVTNVSCPDNQKLIPISSVLVFDISISMSWGPPRIQLAKDAANIWVDGLPLGLSECALVAFESRSFIVKDFTTNRQLLKKDISLLNPGGGTDYNEALLEPPCGGLQVALLGQFKKVIVFLTDGLSVFEPKTEEIINFANQNKIVIYAVTLDMPAPQCIKDMTLKTGGTYFENIMTQKEALDVYTNLLNLAQDGESCQIEWLSNASCKNEFREVELNLNQLNLKAKEKYQFPINSVANLEFTPTSIKCKNAIPGIKKDTTITITAKKADFNITNITSSNPSYFVKPSNFFLPSGQSKELTVSYIPTDSSFSITKFTFENDKCPRNCYVSGGYPGKKSKIKTLKLIQPNGGESFVVGMDTVITWEGVLPDEKVIIEYTTDNGTNWIPITDSAKGLTYEWHIPKTPSKLCLARVTASAASFIGSEVMICNQIWMCSNLDVATYRNGDTIPEVTDSTEWANLKTGAWCYYNNDPGMGPIYGRLYNFYAVSDSRGLAPEGWHIASDAEWAELEKCLGGWAPSGGKLKSTGTIKDGDGLWWEPNTGATNESGYSAIPGGIRSYSNGSIIIDGSFGSIGLGGVWWTSTVDGGTYSLIRSLVYNDNSLGWNVCHWRYGLSVRCVRD